MIRLHTHKNRRIKKKFDHKIIKLDKNWWIKHEHVGSKILAKIKIYILTKAELLFTLCYEIPCRSILVWHKIFGPAQTIFWTCRRTRHKSNLWIPKFVFIVRFITFLVFWFFGRFGQSQQSSLFTLKKNAHFSKDLLFFPCFLKRDQVKFHFL